MSDDKDIIRNMVIALSNGDHEAAQQASSEVITAKTARIISDNAITEGDMMHRAAKRHFNSAKRMNRNKNRAMRANSRDRMNEETSPEAIHDQLGADDDYQAVIKREDIRDMRMMLRDYGLDYSKEAAMRQLNYAKQAGDHSMDNRDVNRGDDFDERNEY